MDIADNSKCISYLKFRHIRYVNKYGNFVKVRRKFRDYKELISFLEKRNYSDAYYSVARFLNPEQISARKAESTFQTIFLGMDLFFDVDVKEGSLESRISKAAKEVVKIIDFSNSNGWKLNYIAFSGSKGFHVSFTDPFDYTEISLPDMREQKAKENREAIVAEMFAAGILFDKEITIDTRRIVRIPGTYNSKTGMMCKCISFEDLLLPAKELLKTIPFNRNYKRETSLFSQVMRKLRYVGIINALGFSLDPVQKIESVSGITSNAGKNHVIILRLNDFGYRQKKVLSELYIPYGVFGDRFGIFLFSPVIIQKNQFFKLAKALKSPSLHALKKYRHTFLPLAYHDANMRSVGAERRIIAVSSISTSVCCSKNHLIVFQNIFNTKLNCGANLKSPSLVFRILKRI